MKMHHVCQMAGGVALIVFALSITSCEHPVPPPPVIKDPLLLQEGDSIEVDLTGTPDVIPPATFALSGTGAISPPRLPTNVIAIGRTPHDLEKEIHDLYLSSGVYTSINVTVIPGPRYYYVTGAIIPNGPGKQLYTGKVTVLGAVSAAGGFNPHAAKFRVRLTRQDGRVYLEDCNKALEDPSLDMEVLPNDKINVGELTLPEILMGKK